MGIIKIPTAADPAPILHPPSSGRTKCVLFDLDGTLVDTAPDLGFAANAVRAEAGLAPLPLADYRPVASAGARGLLGVAMGLKPEDSGYPPQRDLFLKVYRDNLSRESKLFGGMDEALAELEKKRVRWGIVTNKPDWLAQPLVESLGLAPRMACLIGAREGLTPKPAPDGLLLACRQLSLNPSECVYVGDDRRDVDAARAAGMPAIVAAWGYIGAGERIADWGAGGIVNRPVELLSLV